MSCFSTVVLLFTERLLIYVHYILLLARMEAILPRWESTPGCMNMYDASVHVLHLAAYVSLLAYCSEAERGTGKPHMPRKYCFLCSCLYW